MNYHSFWEEDGQKQEILVNRNPMENNDCMTALKTVFCVCVCLNAFPCYSAEPVCGHLPHLEKHMKEEMRKS